MRFEITPEEAQQSAGAMVRYFKKHKMTVIIEKPAWPDAPYRTTITAKKSGRHILVEAQGILSYGRSLKDLAAWLVRKRYCAELYLATHEGGLLQAGVLQEMKLDGIGLFVVSDTEEVTEQQQARNQALIVTPDPTLKYGTLKNKVSEAIQKFNYMNRKDGLRDMCELVEQLSEEVGVVACRKGMLKIPEKDFVAKDWASQINELARKEAYIPPHNPAISASLKDDLQSFRGARNLVDHKVRYQRENAKREKQFAERMVQGPRLFADLVSIKRKIK